MIFLLQCKKNPALFYAKNRTKISLKLPVLLLELFKTANFFQKILTYEFFDFFPFFNISGTAQDILTFQKVLSLW